MKLKKSIGEKTLLFLSINAIMGTGIFFLPAVGALYSGPASIIAWVIMSVVAVLISMYFAELISMYPKSGGIYEYSKHALGNLWGFVVGWISWIIANVTIAMLVVGSILYLFPGAGILFSLSLSLAIILLFNYIGYRGIDFSAKMLLFFGIFTVMSLLILIVPGFIHINPVNFSPIIISPMILLSLFFISETFFGWETACYLTEEVKNGRKVVPKMIVNATIIISAISIMLVIVSLGSVNWQVFAMQEAPLAFLAKIFFGEKLATIYAVLIFIPLIGTAASWIISSPRLLFAMARDKVIPTNFNKIHKDYKTPQNAIIFQVIATSIVTLTAFGDYLALLSSLIPLVIITYSAVMLSVIKLRINKPHAKRFYRAPFGIAGPAAIILFNLMLLGVWLYTVEDAFSIFLMDLFLVSFGFPLYFLIKFQTDRKFVEKFYDKISGIWDIYFPLWYTENEARKVIRKLKLKNNMAVLDFGSGTGVTTLELAKKLGSKGTIVAVDLSQKQLEKAFQKIKKAMQISNVIFVKEHELTFDDNTFDAVVAVSVLEHLNNPEKSMMQVMKLLKKSGEFSFFSFGKSFGIPAPEFLGSRESIEMFFKKINIKPNIKIIRKKFTEYIYIWGRKPRNWKS